MKGVGTKAVAEKLGDLLNDRPAVHVTEVALLLSDSDVAQVEVIEAVINFLKPAVLQLRREGRPLVTMTSAWWANGFTDRLWRAEGTNRKAVIRSALAGYTFGARGVGVLQPDASNPVHQLVWIEAQTNADHRIGGLIRLQKQQLLLGAGRGLPTLAAGTEG